MLCHIYISHPIPSQEYISCWLRTTLLKDDHPGGLEGKQHGRHLQARIRPYGLFISLIDDSSFRFSPCPATILCGKASILVVPHYKTAWPMDPWLHQSVASLRWSPHLQIDRRRQSSPGTWSNGGRVAGVRAASIDRCGEGADLPLREGPRVRAHPHRQLQEGAQAPRVHQASATHDTLSCLIIWGS